MLENNGLDPEYADITPKGLSADAPGGSEDEGGAEALDVNACLEFALEHMQITETPPMLEIRRRFREEKLSHDNCVALLGEYQDIARGLIVGLDEHDQFVTTRADIGLMLMSAILCYQQGLYDDYNSNIDGVYYVLASVEDFLQMGVVKAKIDSIF